MKTFKRIEPTTKLETGLQYKWRVIVKRFKTEDDIEHEFTTIGDEGERAGAVIALTPDNKVITTYQFRAGPERWMYELPGGGFYEKEEPQAAALRELKEETAYVPSNVEFLGKSSRDAYTNIVWYYYLATGCTVTGARNLDKEEHEQGAEVRLISITDLIHYAKNDQMTDPHAVLMAYDKLKEMMKGNKTDGAKSN